MGYREEIDKKDSLLQSVAFLIIMIWSFIEIIFVAWRVGGDFSSISEVMLALITFASLVFLILFLSRFAIYIFPNSMGAALVERIENLSKTLDLSQYSEGDIKNLSATQISVIGTEAIIFNVLLSEISSTKNLREVHLRLVKIENSLNEAGITPAADEVKSSAGQSQPAPPHGQP